MKGERMMPVGDGEALRLATAKTTLGWVAVVAGSQGIRWVTLEKREKEARAQALQQFPGLALGGDGGLARELAVVVDAVEAPLRPWKARLDLRGTAFQRAVWDALRRIPAGEVRTYAEIAREIGHPKAVRAVGTACGANPVPFLVPCHRVVASGGGLGGFGLGLPVKQALLVREGVL